MTNSLVSKQRLKWKQFENSTNSRTSILWTEIFRKHI